MGRLITKLKYGAIAIIAIAVVLFFSMEIVQKKTLDIKADTIGTNRTVTFYSFTGQPIQSYSDKSMRFDALPTGGISVWLGSQNRKIHSNTDYIVQDK